MCAVIVHEIWDCTDPAVPIAAGIDDFVLIIQAMMVLQPP